MSAGVGEISSDLRRARERAGLRIEDVSARTKINPAFLRALETGHFETLPGHFFTRAFLKTYAREVGLSPDEVAHDFDRMYGSAVAVGVAEPALPIRDETQREFIEGPLSSFHLPRYGWPLALAACIVIVIVALAKRQGPPPPSPAPIGTSGPATPAPVPAREAEQPAPEPPDTLTIQVQASETVWVAATSDGASAVYKLLQPGEQVTVTGRSTFFRIGNAAAFSYSINGAPGKPLGKPGEVREVRITLDNYREYLRSP